MPTWFNWTPLHPMLERYFDDGTRDLCTTTINVHDVGTFEVSLVGSPHRAELVRVGTLNSDGNLSAKQLEVVDKLMDHSIALLKLTVDPGYDRLRFGERTPNFGAHGVDGKPSLNLSMRMTDGLPEDVGTAFRTALGASIEHRPLIMLLADATSPTLPLQYRYLSLYKILELEFRAAGRWSGLDEVLAPYFDKYRERNISTRSLPNLVHEMRDKCAHIKVGGNDSIGILGLSGEDAATVRRLMVLLREIVVEHINRKGTGIQFQFLSSSDDTV